MWLAIIWNKDGPVYWRIDIVLSIENKTRR